MESNPIGKIDRISELPDSLLSLILCNLPTKNAVGTSILSTRWKNLYPFEVMPKKLDLDDSLLLNRRRKNNLNSSSSSFIDFVDRLLSVTLSDVKSVEEIILHCAKDYGVDKVVSWVCAALQLNVRNLDLKFVSKTNNLFHSLNGCTTLVTLRLWLESECCPPDTFILPNVKTLYLAKLIFDDEAGEPIIKLIAGCPALEDLHLYRCNLRNLYDVDIVCPLLKKLAIEGCWEKFLGGLMLVTPKLEVLIYNGFLARYYNVGDFNSLHTAHIDIGPSQELLDAEEDQEDDDEYVRFFDNTAMIVSCCSSTIRLYLSNYTVDALRYSSVQLPVFHNLMWLSLGYLHWSVLARLLQIAPNLEHLIIEKMFQVNEGGFQNFRQLLPTPPECLVLHVKKIEFLFFEGDEDEINFVGYLLKNGEVLEDLILRCYPSVNMGILTRLLMLPRQSKTCQIECRRI